MEEKEKLKMTKIEKMRGYCAEVKAEKDKTEEDERKHIYTDKPITYFPYTHGDSLEVARSKLRVQMNNELREKQAEEESRDRERMGDKYYEQVYCNTQPDIRPQGSIKQEKLKEQFE